MNSRWDDRQHQILDAIEALVCTSRLIGEEPDLVLWGGGNSSVKTIGHDHLGRDIRILWIKGSGSDMRTLTKRQLTPLRLDELLPLLDREDMTDESMVAYQQSCLLDPTAPKPSIETLLHAFLPPAHIYHTHADAICTLTDAAHGSRLLSELYGDSVPLIPYRRPGFRLAKAVALAYRLAPGARAMILQNHGLITWGNQAEEAYRTTIVMVTEAERFIARRAGPRSRKPSASRHPPVETDRLAMASAVSPILRGAMSGRSRIVLHFDGSEETLDFLDQPNARALSQLGPFTPDHILHTKPRPLFLELPNDKNLAELSRAIRCGVEGYRQDYVRYFEQYRTPGVTMLDPNPRVILIPGLGLFVSGKDRRACRITHDLYTHTMKVIRHAEAVDAYTPIATQDQCDFEYWPLENFKLTLLPKEKEMSSRIVLVTGAAGAIGQAIAKRFVDEGASVILADINDLALRELADRLNQQAGEENTLALPLDITNEGSVRLAFEKVALAYGGLDILVSNAGIARGAPVLELTLDDWQRSFDVNATGHFLVCREALRIFQRQGIGGNIVVVATKNLLAPGKEFGAYSASKAAQAQLARVLALEGADFGVRVNMVNPDAVFDGSGIWSKELRAARAKAYGIPVDDLESYCRSRSLLKVAVSAFDVAESVLFLASDRSAKTTGAMIPVDGGVKEAFPR